MSFHDDPFFCSERAVFMKDVVWYSNFTDVVQRGGFIQVFYLLIVKRLGMQTELA
jgi:hypothetical protein